MSLKRKWDNSACQAEKPGFGAPLLKSACQDQFDVFYYCKEFHKYAGNF